MAHPQNVSVEIETVAGSILFTSDPTSQGNFLYRFTMPEHLAYQLMNNLANQLQRASRERKPIEAYPTEWPGDDYDL